MHYQDFSKVIYHFVGILESCGRPDPSMASGGNATPAVVLGTRSHALGVIEPPHGLPYGGL